MRAPRGSGVQDWTNDQGLEHPIVFFPDVPNDLHFEKLHCDRFLWDDGLIVVSPTQSNTSQEST